MSMPKNYRYLSRLRPPMPSSQRVKKANSRRWIHKLRIQIFLKEDPRSNDKISRELWKIHLPKRIYLTVLTANETPTQGKKKHSIVTIRCKKYVRFNDTPYSNYVTCSDSMSSVQSIDNCTESNHLLHRLVYQMHESILRGNHIRISWVLSHVGMRGLTDLLGKQRWDLRNLSLYHTAIGFH